MKNYDNYTKCEVSLDTTDPQLVSINEDITAITSLPLPSKHYSAANGR